MQKIAGQSDLFGDRPSDGIYANNALSSAGYAAHAESQYKDDENVHQMPAFENPAGTEESKQEASGNALDQYATRVPQNDQ